MVVVVLRKFAGRREQLSENRWIETGNGIEGERWGKQLSGGVLRIQLYCLNDLVVSVYLAVVVLGPGFKLCWGKRVKKKSKRQRT